MEKSAQKVFDWADIVRDVRLVPGIKTIVDIGRGGTLATQGVFQAVQLVRTVFRIMACNFCRQTFRVQVKSGVNQ